MVVSTRRPEKLSSVGNMSESSSPRGFFRWRHGFALFTAAATFLLIFVGGLVTSTGSALAVPDWPLAFGRLIPPLVGGIRFEWAHRLIAAVVSGLTLILAIWTWFRESRQWVRMLAFAALGLIM